MLKRLWPFIEMPLVYFFLHCVILLLAFIMDLISLKWHPVLPVVLFVLLLFQYATNTLVKRGFKAIVDVICRSTRTVELTFVAQVEEHTGILSEKFVSFSNRETRREPVFVAVFSTHGEFVRFFTSELLLCEPGKNYKVTYTERSKIITSVDLIFNRRW